MAIDQVKFGELIGTVGALVTAVADMKAAILPALKEQRTEMAEHKEQDAKMNAVVTDLADWKNGDINEAGAKKQLNDLIAGKNKMYGIMTGITIVAGATGHKLSQMGDALYNLLKQ